MKAKAVFMVTFGLILATNAAAMALTDEVETSSEDVLTREARDRIQDVIQPQGCIYYPGIGWVCS